MSDSAVVLQDVSKSFGRPAVYAVNNVSLKVSTGERLGIVGPNGSGKTTVIRLILGFLRPEKGRILTFDFENPEKYRGMIGFVPERQQGMENFTPLELLKYTGEMHNMSKQDIEGRRHELLKFSGLADAENRLIGSFSKGMAQRTHIAAALMHRPQLLLLDEALSGIDPTGQEELLELLAQLEDITLILASHHLQEIEALCQRAIIMNRGEIAETITIDRLANTLHTLVIDPIDPEKLQSLALADAEISRDGDFVNLRFSATAEEFLTIIQQIREKGIVVHKMRSRSYLEDVYHQYAAENTAQAS